MELPFKYIVLTIIKTLNDRNMSLVIDKCDLVNYFTLFMKRSLFTIEEKEEIGKNLDFDCELDSLIMKYYKYFDVQNDQIVFDEDYADEINELLMLEKEEYDTVFIHDIDCVIEDNVAFLEIIGVKIKKDLYYFLLDIERKIENCYMELCNLEIYSNSGKLDASNIINEIKKLNIKEIVILLDMKNLLSENEYLDLLLFAGDEAWKNNEIGVSNDFGINFLIEDDVVDEIAIADDAFQRSIFTGYESCTTNLREKMDVIYEIDSNMKYSILKFYSTFLELLKNEINSSNALISMDLIKIKYRLMYTIDSMYGTALFMNKKIDNDKDFKENYSFIAYEIYYLINEILLYDDEKYRNKNFDMDNTIIYLNNTIKKLLIETYYRLTDDKNVIVSIKENKLYGVNTISSSFLSGIIEKPKSRIKEL